MSAPETNVEKQKKRHRAPLVGIALAVAAGVIFMAIWLVWATEEGNTPVEDNTPAIAEPPASN